MKNRFGISYSTMSLCAMFFILKSNTTWSFFYILFHKVLSVLHIQQHILLYILLGIKREETGGSTKNYLFKVGKVCCTKKGVYRALLSFWRFRMCCLLFQ
jgi:hypothetical protein